MAKFGMRNTKTIFSTTDNKGMGQDLTTVAKDEKIRLSTTVYATNRYQDHIWYDESENHTLDEQRQRGGEVPSN